ncbi:Calmodulin-binding transcription activator 1 [Ameca splendens]|uniref:Calmodulin-binding transcription activator 1 n=1 Tax=Ameca splendens TaxID=208324 RepID=A0ABV0ZXT3_9TELE
MCQFAANTHTFTYSIPVGSACHQACSQCSITSFHWDNDCDFLRIDLHQLTSVTLHMGMCVCCQGESAAAVSACACVWEIAAYLITFEKHDEWLTTSPKTRPQNGSMILYNRKKVKYRKDGYCWKKRKDGKTTREDHMKLKVQGVECLYGCYVHSSIIPTFHRRCYWLLQNPDIVLVHYLNVPAVDDSGKPCGPVLCSINTDRKEWAKWSKEELIGQLKPMYAAGAPEVRGKQVLVIFI